MSGSMPYIAPGERFVLHAIKYTSQSAAVRPNQCFDWSGLLSFGQVTPKAFSTNSIPRVSEGGVLCGKLSARRWPHGHHSSSGAAR
jgi:hypothetical protein